MPTMDILGGYSEDSAKQFNAQTSVNMITTIDSVDGGKGRVKKEAISGILEGVLNIASNDNTPFIFLDAIDGTNGYSYILYAYFTPQGAISYRFSVFSPISVRASYSFSGGTMGDILFRDGLHFGKLLDNGLVINIVTFEKSFFYDSTLNTFTQITDGDFPEVVFDAEYKDGYFVWGGGSIGTFFGQFSNDRFYISSLFATDPADCVSALDFGVAESNPDYISGLAIAGNELVALGERSTEFFYNSGNLDFPFERNSGATGSFGMPSVSGLGSGSGVRFNIVNQKCRIGSSNYFIGSLDGGTLGVFVLSGYQIQRISNDYIEGQIKGFTQKLGISFNPLQINNVAFISITGGVEETTGGVTTKKYYSLLYNTAVGEWSKNYCTGLAYKDNVPLTWMYPCYKTLGERAIFQFPFYDYNLDKTFYKLMIGKFGDNEIYLDKTYNGDLQAVATSIPIEVTFKHVFFENKNILVKSLEFDVQRGVGNLLQPNPYIDLYVSRDGGMTYGNAIPLKLGASGKYKSRLKASMLGTARDFVFRIKGNMSVQFELLSAIVDYEVLDG